jgi:hypothetical protein
MQRQLRSRDPAIGGAIGYPSAELFEEVAYVAYHFHWSYVDLMGLEHLERHRWMREIAKINERLNEAEDNEDRYI